MNTFRSYVFLLFAVYHRAIGYEDIYPKIFFSYNKYKKPWREQNKLQENA
jgi:hypothetical protein